MGAHVDRKRDHAIRKVYMKLLAPYFEFADHRGLVQGISNELTFEELNLVISEPGATRGGHYHQTLSELIVLVSGRVKVEVVKRDGSLVLGASLLPGAVVLIEPEEIHTFVALERATWLNALTKKMHQTAPDIVAA